MVNAKSRLTLTRSFVCLVLLLFCLAPLALIQTRAAADKSGQQPLATAASPGKIAFASDRDGNLEIYSMDGDGGAQTRLTQNSAEDYQPAWSPDGKRIAFVSTRDGNEEIYVMN